MSQNVGEPGFQENREEGGTIYGTVFLVFSPKAEVIHTAMKLDL